MFCLPEEDSPGLGLGMEEAEGEFVETVAAVEEVDGLTVESRKWMMESKVFVIVDKGFT